MFIFETKIVYLTSTIKTVATTVTHLRPQIDFKIATTLRQYYLMWFPQADKYWQTNHDRKVMYSFL